MTELTFTKTFLSTLDSRPIKLQPDYTIPPRNLEIHAAYTLPKMPRPMTKPSSSSTSSTNPSSTLVHITLRSAKNPPLELQLKDVDASTVTVLELKEKIVSELKGGAELGKVKVLWEKKPVSDAKTVKEVIGAEAKAEVELGVLIMGYKAPNAGVAAASAGQKGTAEAASGKEAGEALDEGFWGDLKGFLQQRLKDQGKADEVVGVFKGAWEAK